MNPPSLVRERQFWEKQLLVAGVDEAGRGPLAGPVVAAAVILPVGFRLSGLDDSKKLSAKLRDKYYSIISEKALSVGVGIVEHAEIDRINIHQASLLAMRIAIEQLGEKPDHVLLDGRFKIDFRQSVIPQLFSLAQTAIIGGDRKSVSIAAASVIAKVTRDRIMHEMHKKYPQYGFDRHKGYGTKAHFAAIRKFGLTEIHRRSFCTSK